MTDLRDPRWIYFKGGLFLLGGIVASALVLLEHPSWKLAAFVAVAVWCFCRAYYFAFYVIEHYIDPAYKFAGLTAFVRYLWEQRRSRRNHSSKQAVSPPRSVPDSPETGSSPCERSDYSA